MAQGRVFPDSLYAAAQELAVVGKHIDAIEAYSQAIERDSNHLLARIGRGMSLQRFGDHSGAIADFDDVITRFPDWAGGYVAYYCRAVSRGVLGQNIEAVMDCDEAIRKNAEHADAFYLRGTAHEKLGNIETAINDMDSALRFQPGHFEASYVRGKLRFVQRRWRESRDDVAAAMNGIDDDSEVFRKWIYLRGMASQELGDHRAAISDFTRVIELAPDDGHPYLRRARSNHALGDFALGDADFQIGKRLIQGLARSHEL